MRLRRLFIASLCFAFLLVSRVHAEEGTFDSNGVKIHYSVEGQGEPVLLIHGFAATPEWNWRRPGIVDNLTAHYKVILIDNRGHGQSGKPHDPAQYGTEMVNDQVRLLDHLGIKKAHIVGYSMGGFITAKLVTMYPDRCITAVLGGAGWSRANDGGEMFRNVIATSLEEGKGFGPLMEALTPPGKPKPSSDEIAGMNAVLTAQNDVKALAAAMRGMSQLTVTEEQLEANEVPCLALVGANDPLKAGVDAMEPVMKNLKVVVIDDADHMDAVGKTQFIEALDAWLAEHSAKKPAPVGAGG